MAEICPLCGLAHGQSEDGDLVTLVACSAEQGFAMGRLLRAIAGEPVKCRGCEAAIYWVTHKNGKRTPYTAAGLNHFIDCPAAAQFGKKADA